LKGNADGTDVVALLHKTYVEVNRSCTNPVFSCAQ